MRSLSVAILVGIMIAAMVGCGGTTEKQVLIASNPAGAVVKIGGAEVGHTPVSLTFAEETTISVEQTGYESQELQVDKSTGPNLIVELKRIEIPEGKKADFSTMRQIKSAHNDGSISREQYDRFKTKIRANRAVELERAKRDLRQGRITEGKYKQRVRAIKQKYEG